MQLLNLILLKKSSERILSDNGLKIYISKTDSDGSFICAIVKPVDVVGNKVKNYGVVNLVEYHEGNRIISKTDLPVLALSLRSNKWILDCSESAPIPGPGDFHLEFENEDDIVSYVLKYFFEENQHIIDLQNYLLQNNCT